MVPNRGLETETTQSEAALRLNRWLEQLVAEKGSDLLLIADAPASIRVEGETCKIESTPLTGPEIEAAVLPALAPHAAENYRQDHIADASYRVPGHVRFLINLHLERGRAASSVLEFTSKVPSFADLNM